MLEKKQTQFLLIDVKTRKKKPHQIDLITLLFVMSGSLSYHQFFHTSSSFFKKMTNLFVHYI